MLVFQKDFDGRKVFGSQKDGRGHIEDRSIDRVGITPEWLLEIVGEINLYLPDDWRMTRSRNNFFIQVVANKSFLLIGHTYKTNDACIVHIIDTLLLKEGFDQFALQAYQLSSKTPAESWKTQLIESDSLNPNLYFFQPRPENASSPLFARQYEKLKQKPDKKFVGDQYHRIHPMTKAGLDGEHFRWIRRTTEGDVQFVDVVDPDYHGKDFWIIPVMGADNKRGEYRSYLTAYDDLFKRYKILQPAPPATQMTPYEIEYKFMVQGRMHDAGAAVLLIEDWIQQNSCKINEDEKDRRAKKQIDVYFDDKDFSLHQAGVSFRVREKQDNIRATLKKRLPLKRNYSEEGLYERIEEEAVITLAQKESLFRGQVINVLPYRLIAYIVPDCGKLQSIFQVSNERKTVVFRDEEHRAAELCFDKVTYDIDGRSYGPHLEIEIESKGMPRDQMKELALFLEKDLGLIPSRQSKYERGVSLMKTRRAMKQEGEGRKIVIIDTDCGVDDALALILALKSPELDVKAITTVAGNVELPKVMTNVWKVLNAMRLPTPPPVAYGADRPLAWLPEKKPIKADSVHGEDGLGDAFDAPKEIPYDKRKAWDLICDLAKERPKEITLITVGPLTNLAWAIRKRPEDVKCLKEVVSMGGVFFKIGNIAPDAEFNVAVDPHAAAEVVEFCRNSCLKTPVDKQGKEVILPPAPSKEDYQKIVAYRAHDPKDPAMLPLTFVGLDVTHRVLLRKAALEKAITAHPHNQLISFIYKISKKYMSFYYDNEELPGCYLHDPLAVAYVINPAFLTVKPHIVRVETEGRFTNGVIYPDDRPTRNPAWRNPAEEVIHVAHAVEREAFEEFFFQRITTADIVKGTHP